MAKTRADTADEAQDASLTEKAYRLLEEMIVTLQLAPGESVSEGVLSQRLGIGRTPIREAVQRLAREKLLTILPRRGVIVAEVNVATQLRLLETRREVERVLVRRGAKRASPEQRRRFTTIAAGMEKAARTNDDLTFMRLDREFNRLEIEAGQNEFAAGAMALMQGLARRFWYIHYKQAADIGLAARLHADVARKIAEGDENGAAAASDRLMDYIESFTRATVDGA